MIVDNHATLTISSRTRTAASITELLGVEPTKSHEIGDPRLRPGGDPVQHPPFEWEAAVWNLDADDEGEGEDRSGTGSIAAAIAPLRGLKDKIDQLHEDCEISLRWWGSSDSSQGGLVLPEELIAELAALRCPVYMTSYFDDEDETP